MQMRADIAGAACARDRPAISSSQGPNRGQVVYPPALMGEYTPLSRTV